MRSGLIHVSISHLTDREKIQAVCYIKLDPQSSPIPLLKLTMEISVKCRYQARVRRIHRTSSA